jgi:gas vesicle protein
MNSTALFVGIIVGAAVVAIVAITMSAKDSPSNRKDMTGFSIIVDPDTRCEYLSRSSGLTPRLDATGKHICAVSP